MASKSSRKVLLAGEDKKQGRSQRMNTVDFSEEKPIKGWIAGVDFPVLLFRQVLFFWSSQSYQLHSYNKRIPPCYQGVIKGVPNKAKIIVFKALIPHKHSVHKFEQS